MGILFLACSMRSSKMSQRATRRALGSLTTKLASNVPRPPEPISPTLTPELAAVPRIAVIGSRPAALTRSRREMVFIVPSLLSPVPRACQSGYDEPVGETTTGRRYHLVDFADVPGVPCPCGTARRAFADVPEVPA